MLGAVIPVDNAPVDAVLRADFQKYMDGMQEVQNARVKTQSEADRILTKYEQVFVQTISKRGRADYLATKALPIRQFLLTNLVKSPHTNHLVMRIPIRTLASSLTHMGDFPYKSPYEASYRGPALFVRGIKSHYVADDVLPVIGQFFPRFIVKDIDSGHWVISEQPEAFRQAVVTFLLDSCAD
ncbi:MAG: hypothetical protein Q9174_001108 [Haloplaca sp. 1 TL-2023]